MTSRQFLQGQIRRHLHGLPGLRGVFYRIDAARQGERDALAERDRALAERDQAVVQRDAALAAQEAMSQRLGALAAERDAALLEAQDVLRWASQPNRANSNPATGAVDPLTPFQCNICGTFNLVPRSMIHREVSSCRRCGSSVRFRSIVHLVCLALHGKSVPLPECTPDRTIRGVGLSDWTGYADPLAALYDFTNTFYHMEPLLDIVEPPADMLGRFDFLTTSDVFEHVPPPVSRAFAGSYALLKPGGHMVLTVPWVDMPATNEHYPQMRDFRVVEFDGKYAVVVRNADGSTTTHADPVFHGGPGQTLEMRMFALADLLRLIEAAGFVDVTIMDEDIPRFGIASPERFSLPILARKPLA